MYFSNTKMKQNQGNPKPLRSLLLCFIAALPMACAAGPFSNTELRAVADFNKIEVGGLVNVSLQKGDKTEVEVSAYGIQLEDIVTDVKDGTLLVTTKGQHSGESISIRVSYTDLLALKTSGAATITTAGVLEADSINIEITENGDASLEIDVNQVSIDMRGNGNLRISGRAVTQSLKAHGGGGSLNNSKLKIAHQAS